MPAACADNDSFPLAGSIGVVGAVAVSVTEMDDDTVAGTLTDSVCELVEDRLACTDGDSVAVGARVFAEAETRAAWLVVERAEAESSLAPVEKSLAETDEDSAAGKTSFWLKLQDCLLDSVKGVGLARSEFDCSDTCELRVADDAICIWLTVEGSIVETNLPLGAESLAETAVDAAAGITSVWLKLPDLRLTAVHGPWLATVESFISEASEPFATAEAMCL